MEKKNIWKYIFPWHYGIIALSLLIYIKVVSENERSMQWNILNFTPVSKLNAHGMNECI